MSVPEKAQKGRDSRVFLQQLSQLNVEEGRNEAERAGVTLHQTKPAGKHPKGSRSVGHKNCLVCQN